MFCKINKIKKKTVYIYAKGCNSRSLDASRLEKYFIANGYRILNRPDRAEKIIYVSCAFNEEKETEAINQIRELSKYQDRLLVYGCLPSINRERMGQIFKGEYLETQKINDIDRFFPGFIYQFHEISDGNLIFKIRKQDPKTLLQLYMNRAKNAVRRILARILPESIYRLICQAINESYKIRVSWGCSGSCTYCAARLAVGNLRSKPPEECIREFKNGLNEGYRWFELTADDPGSYGIDIGYTLPKLIRRMMEEDPDHKLSSLFINKLNPRYLVRYREELIALVHQAKIDYIYCNLQSGNPRILQLMNRFPEIDKVLNTLNELKRSKPKLHLITDIIIGFPSETEEEFRDSLDAVIQGGFEHASLFIFDAKIGTKAYEMEDQIPDKVKESRLYQAIERFQKENIGYYWYKGTQTGGRHAESLKKFWYKIY